MEPHLVPSGESFDESSSDDVTRVSRAEVQVLNLVGEGSFGICCSAKARIPGKGLLEHLVLKMTPPTTDPNWASAIQQMGNEIKFLSQISNIRVVTFIAEVIDPGEDYWKGFLMERMVIGSLSDFIFKNEFEQLASNGFLTEICKEIAEAIQYLHIAFIIHGDINPNNILLNDVNGQLHLKLSDFGTAFRIGDILSDIDFGTPIFSAPEVHYGSACTTSSDVFSFAMTAYFTMYKRFPLLSWDGNSRTLHTALMRDVEDLHGRAKIGDSGTLESTQIPKRPPLENNDLVDNIIASAWSPTPKVRPSIEEIVNQLREA